MASEGLVVVGGVFACKCWLSVHVWVWVGEVVGVGVRGWWGMGGGRSAYMCW